MGPAFIDGVNVTEKSRAKQLDLIHSLFHEPWWLQAVTGGRYTEVTVQRGEQLVAKLPFVVSRRGLFRVSNLPAFTHVLGPALQPGAGKPQSQIKRRLSIVRELIDQLPNLDFFKQVLDPSIDGGLASVDGLALQEHGFKISPQYTFQIDARNALADIWEGMHTTVRQHIRRAKAIHHISEVDHPDTFVSFYVRNIEKTDKINRTDFSRFKDLYLECRARNCGELLGAFNRDGSPVAMVFVVWGFGVMYYLLSTRSPEAGNSAVSYLIWSAIERANQLQLVFDLDGVYSLGTARFLSGFGGQVKMRLVATRAKRIYAMAQSTKRVFAPSEAEYFT